MIQVQKIFFLFDSVHLIKAIRNNWLTSDQVMFFPSFLDGDVMCANLQNLKDIYDKEKNSVIKTAPKLSFKVFYPNSVEKQNVKYALNLFHERNCIALDLHADKLDNNVFSTKMFIDVINKWWKIMNVKHPSKGKDLNDTMSDPIVGLQDDNFIFLENFCVWLNEWEKLYALKADEKRKKGIPVKGGLLSKETLFALKFTTNSVIKMIRYIFESIGCSYILLGKFQTDSLEARFGQYRQMCGGNYNVSCIQVMEAEKKLRVLSLIKLAFRETW